MQATARRGRRTSGVPGVSGVSGVAVVSGVPGVTGVAGVSKLSGVSGVLSWLAVAGVGPATAPVGLRRDLVRFEAPAGQHLAEPATTRASPSRYACPWPGGSGTCAIAAASASGWPAGPPARCSQVTCVLATACRSCSSSGPGISSSTRAGAPQGSDSAIRKIAGKADSSPTKRCQSASLRRRDLSPRPDRLDLVCWLRRPHPALARAVAVQDHVESDGLAGLVQVADGVSPADRPVALDADEQHHVLPGQDSRSWRAVAQ